MIHVKCFTNLDDFRQEKWPEVFACRPLLGDIVQSISSSRILKVVRISHAGHESPYLRVELHRP